MTEGTISIPVLSSATEKTAVKPESPVDPKEFFQKKKGLYVWSDFTDRIVDKAEPIALGELAIEGFKIETTSKDEQIEEAIQTFERVSDHVFSESQVCAVVAELISKQPEGEEGVLLNTGYSNLFYTPSFVVGVGWIDGGWGVDAWLRGGGAWVSEGRVFSPVN